MKSAKRIVFLLLGSAMSVGAAIAADYEPPIIVDQAPEVVPVEVGSGWYLRGDITYNVSRSVYDVETPPTFEADHTRFGGGVGIGYHFTDYLRSDVNVAAINIDRFQDTDPSFDAEFKNAQWAAMANLYVDLGTVAGFTPYVGVGAGALFSNARIDAAYPDWGTVGVNDSQTRFAYSVNAGVAYKLTQNTSVDLGYQYFSSPGTEYIDPDTLAIDEGVDYHQVKVGLRYDLW